MSLVVAGAAFTSIAAIVYCVRRAVAPAKDLTEVLSNTSVTHITSRNQLQQLIATGGKAVVYLTASW